MYGDDFLPPDCPVLDLTNGAGALVGLDGDCMSEELLLNMIAEMET